jgi:cytochrome c553
MNRWALAALIALTAPAAMAADSALEWAYPVPPPDFPPPDAKILKSAKGTTTGLKLTQAQIDDPFNPPDWFPDEHPALPQVVAHGRAPHVRACMVCHLPNGNGHPESTSISGLTANYIVEQMHEFRDGNRTGIRTPVMVEIAKDITEDELKDAARYFSALKNFKWMRVIESPTAPKNFISQGGKRFVDKSGGTVPVGATMIYEIAEDADGALNRDQHAAFIDYVPVGSIRKGEALVAAGGNGKTFQCSICHGPEYKGVGDVPRLAGRSAYTIVRQLKDIQTGARKGTPVALMQPVVKNLSDENIVDIAAYMASREP